MKKYSDTDISWDISRPLKTAYINLENGETMKVPDYILDKKKNILKGDSVALLWYNGEPIYTEPVGKGTTIKSIFLAVERGMNKYIDISNANIIYPLIGQFYKSVDRLNLIKKFETGKLMPKDLVGDHKLYAGNIGRKNKIWMFALDS